MSAAAKVAQKAAASPAMAQTHKVALVGFGTVGKGFCEIVKMKQAMLNARYGLNISVVAVSDFKKGSIYHPDGIDIDSLLKWDDAGKSLSEFDQSGSGYQRGWDALKTCKDTNADSLLEVAFTNLTDGMPAIDHVKTSLTNGKNVITTNKGPVVFG